MTALNKLTDGQLLFRLQDFYGAEQDAIKINDHEYAQECSDIVSVIREVMESRKALEAAENRMTELESRTVTLPEPFKLAKSSSGLTYYYADEVDAAIQAAGIGVKGE
ncbi:hypothetical protein OGW08_21470 [Citrobacter sp. Cf122]|uniref:hypothetical protein n=1 Tax=Citrobacter sp. Cf122 TaxID=2985072 RepID=UPI00257874C3|nr:hypothetical protein [Citrobacter sp. Cf122]MDM3156626.1 hypothetical protein [Citrobacter sp. Cf122]